MAHLKIAIHLNILIKKKNCEKNSVMFLKKKHFVNPYSKKNVFKNIASYLKLLAMTL